MKNYKFLTIFMALLMVTSISIPAVSQAKENEKGHKNEVKTKFISPGICKLISQDRVPFGWAKKWFNVASSSIATDCALIATSTPKAPKTDTTAPIIRDISNFTGRTFAVITWKTSEKTESKVYWSTSNVSTSSPANVVASFGMGENHFALITGLTAGTEYKAIIVATDKAGNKGYSSQFSFTTSGNVVVPDVTAPVISSIGTTVGTSTINVSWNTNEQANSKVYYGTTTPIATSSASFVSSASLVTSHSVQLTGLATGTPYFLVISSADASANTSLSTQFSTTTLSN